jgi:hypothetical protein
VSARVPTEELASLVTALKAFRDEAAIVVALDPPDAERVAALRSSFAEITRRAGARLDERLRFDLRAAQTDWAVDAASVARVAELIRRVDVALDASERIRAHRRGPALVVGSVLLWVLASIGLVLTVISVFIALAALGSDTFVDETRRGLSSALFYAFLSLAFAAAAVALWRRGDPRPHMVGGRALVTLAAAGIVVSVVSSVAVSGGNATPVLLAGQRYDIAAASILPPGTSGWEQKRTTSDAGAEVIEFNRDVGSRRIAADNETLRAVLSSSPMRANLVPPRDFVEQAIAGIGADDEGGRLTTVSFSTREAAGLPVCRRYDRVAKDTGVTAFPGSIFVLRSHGVMCLESTASDVILVEWSQRYLEGSTPKVADIEAEPFLASLQLKARPRVTPASAALPPVGATLFTDRLSDNHSNWTTSDNEFAKLGTLGAVGGHGIQMKKAAQAHLGSPAIGKARDAVVEAEYFMLAKTVAVVGPTCRADDAYRSFYTFVVSGNGEYAIGRADAGKWSTLASSGAFVRRSLAAPAPVRIAGYCFTTGDSVSLMLVVNGVPLLRVEDREGAIAREGRFGFYAESPGPTGTIKMTSFTVKAIAR